MLEFLIAKNAYFLILAILSLWALDWKILSDPTDVLISPDAEAHGYLIKSLWQHFKEKPIYCLMILIFSSAAITGMSLQVLTHYGFIVL